MAEPQSNTSQCSKCGRLTGSALHHCPFIPAPDRFWSKVQIGSLDECWLWLGGQSPDGYGKFKAGRQTVRSHRFAWELENGSIPTGMQVLHRCDVPLCCNVKHCLFLGTNDDNMADMAKKGRAARGELHGSRTHPERVPRGERHGLYIHPERRARGTRHGRTHLSEEDVRAIRRARESLKILARRYGLGKTTVGHIRAGRSWRHVP